MRAVTVLQEIFLCLVLLLLVQAVVRLVPMVNILPLLLLILPAQTNVKMFVFLISVEVVLLLPLTVLK